MAVQFNETLISRIVWGAYHVPWLAYDPDGLLLSGAPERDPFLLTLSGAERRLLQLCAQSGGPQVLSTELNHVWAGIPVSLDGHLTRTLVVGPVYTSEVSPQSSLGYARTARLTAAERDKLLAAFPRTPIFPYIEFARLVAVVYTLIYEEELDLARLTPIDLSSAPQPMPGAAQAYRKDRVYDEGYIHATYAFEQQIWSYVREGKLARLKQHLYAGTYGSVGPISNNDPVRQQKNTFICAVTLATRAAIEGGLSTEVAYSLSDLYIQQVETMHDVLRIIAFSEAMLYDLTTRVRDLRRTHSYSNLVNACCNYIEEHVREKLPTSQVAAAAGFSADYVSRRFRQETGRSIGDYVREAKISEAKPLLKFSELSLAEISELLSFSSQSFFTAVFRDVTGLTPGQYRATASN